MRDDVARAIRTDNERLMKDLEGLRHTLSVAMGSLGIFVHGPQAPRKCEMCGESFGFCTHRVLWLHDPRRGTSHAYLPGNPTPVCDHMDDTVNGDDRCLLCVRGTGG